MKTAATPPSHSAAPSATADNHYFPGSRIRRSYVAALVLTAAAGLIMYGVLIRIANTQQDTADMLSIHASQHDYVQRVTLLFSLLISETDVTARDKLRVELSERLNALEANHTFLVQQAMREHMEPAVYDQYFAGSDALDSRLKYFLAKSRELASMSADVFSLDQPDFVIILTLSPVIKESYQNIFRIYEDINGSNVQHLHAFAYAVLVTLLLLLGGEALIIFRPMEHAIRRQHKQLQEEIQRRAEVETALRRSEHAYRLLADNFPNGVVALFDEDNRHLLVSGSELEKVGLKQSDLVNKSVSELFDAKQAGVIQPYYAAAFHGVSSVFELETLRQIYEVRVRPVKDEEDTVTSGMVMAQNITKRKQAEQALQHSEERFRNISELISDYAYGVEIGQQGVTDMWAVGAFFSITGYRPHEIVERGGWYNIVHEDDWSLIEARTRRLMSGTEDVSEFRIITKSGVLRWLRDYSRPLWDAAGENVIALVGAAQDITDRKLAEAALRKSEEQMRLITENVQDLIGLMNVEFHVIYASPSFQLLLGYDPHSLIGKDSLMFIHPEDYKRCKERRERAVAEKQNTDTQDFRYLHVDGHYVWMETQTTFLYSEQKLSGVIIVARDVSERHMMQTLLLEQEILKGALDKEQELSQLKSRMMTRISHEFRTPLSVIMTTADLMSRYYEKLSPERRVEMREGLVLQTRRITRMLDDISLAVNGNFVPHNLICVPVDIRDLCSSLIAEIRQDMQVTSDIVTDLPDGLCISADRHLMRQALYNILQNAVQYSAEGRPIVVSASREPHTICITVQDSGIGIPEAEIERVFEPFFRGTNLNEVQGLGLGLTIAHAAVTAHQGQIHVSSGPDGGTSVQIQLAPF